MDYKALYQQKLGTVDDALALVKPDDYIACGAYGSDAPAFLSRLHEVADRAPGVHITAKGFPFSTDPQYSSKFHLSSFFLGDQTRKLVQEGLCDYIPTHLHHSPFIGLREGERYKMFVAGVCPMDENGDFYFSVDAQTEYENLEVADRVVLEVNKQMPRIIGAPKINIKDVTLLYEIDRQLPSPPEPPIGEIEQKIANYVLDLIHDGDTLQLGIGAMPNAVGAGLMTKNDLGIHTEMFTSSMAKLMEAGVVTNKKKTLHPGKSVTAFIFTNQESYKFIDGRDDIEVRRVAYVNDPAVIMQNDNMVSVNTCLQLDLTGQIASEAIGYKQFSGTGGASDFAYGAFHSKGGRGIIATASTAKKGTVSKISAMLDPGSIVTISRNIVDYVVTEYGVAHLKDKSVRERANALIEIAHPDFRDQLRDQAREMHFL